MLQINPAELTFKVKKDDANGSFDSLTGSTISSRAYVNAVETAYAGYLKAKDLLDTSIGAASGATNTSDSESGATITEGDAMSGDTATESCNNEIEEKK